MWGPRAAGTCRAVAARLQAEGGAQGLIMSVMRRRSAGLMERGEGRRGGPRAAGPAWAVAVATRLVAEGGAQGWIVSAVLRGWAGPMERSGGGRREPRAAGAGWAVAVAARLEAEEGAQSSDVSEMRRGWSAERREGVVGPMWGRARPMVSGSEAGAQVEITNGFPMGFNHAMRRSDRRLIPRGKPW